MDIVRLPGRGGGGAGAAAFPQDKRGAPIPFPAAR
jgi:hypothetical protein